jgi:hypothetical protein
MIAEMTAIVVMTVIRRSMVTGVIGVPLDATRNLVKTTNVETIQSVATTIGDTKLITAVTR